MKITFRQLRVFDAVASLGSLTKAAEQLNITTSTASAALKELQALIDRPPLFTRVGRNLQLTSEGRQLQPIVRNLLHMGQQIESPRHDGTLTGTVTIGAEELSDTFLAQLAVRFRQLHPGVRVNIVAGRIIEISSLLSRYAVDAIITTSFLRDPGLVLTEIFRERSVICASPLHPLASKPDPTFADLEAEEWCMPQRISLSNQRAMGALRGHMANFNVAVEVNSDAGLREAVRAGCGIACLPLSVVEPDLSSGRLVELKVAGLTLLRSTYHIRKADVERTPAMRAFDDFVLGSFASEDTASFTVPV